MSYQRLKFRLTGVSPLVMHNGRLANPLDPMTKELKRVTGKRGKTDADFEEAARIEFLGGLYLGEDGPCLPGEVIEAAIVAAAKKSRRGMQAKAGILSDGNHRVDYDGPRAPDELWGDVGALARSNPRAARDTVRIYMESVFNEATQDLKGVSRQYGGAGFASAVRGNGQQRHNLEAAVRALPDGETVWTALDRMLTVMEATGYKPAKGSDTYFNSVIGQRLKEGNGPIGKAITDVVAGAVAGAGVGGPKGAVGGATLALKKSAKEIGQERRMLKDGEAIARILTDPKAMSLIRSLASQPAGSKSAEVLTTKLILLANRGVSSIDRN